MPHYRPELWLCIAFSHLVPMILLFQCNNQHKCVSFIVFNKSEITCCFMQHASSQMVVVHLTEIIVN